jgi:hypothetical protein
MIQRLILALSIRLLGAVVVYRGLEALPIAGSLFCRSAPHGEFGPMALSILWGAAPFVLGVWLLGGCRFHAQPWRWLLAA